MNEIKDTFLEYVQDALATPLKNDITVLDDESTMNNSIYEMAVLSLKKNETSFHKVEKEVIKQALGFMDTPGYSPNKQQNIKYENDKKYKKRKYEESNMISPTKKKYGFDFTDMEVEEMNKESPKNGNKSLKRLNDVLSSSIDEIIFLKWPKNILPLTKTYAQIGLPNGNPFSMQLNPDSGIVPHNYFEVIKSPMDLTTIKTKVKDYIYDDFPSFENDLLLVISNGQLFYKNKRDPVRRILTVIEKKIREVLIRAKEELEREISY
eukprot:maker-scaffold_43-snap-gene-1.30-mRNA-1 protein AED:0.00 eAED:0.00 QI:67/1/1/1/1/1/2/1188/264